MKTKKVLLCVLGFSSPILVMCYFKIASPIAINIVDYIGLDDFWGGWWAFMLPFLCLITIILSVLLMFYKEIHGE